MKNGTSDHLLGYSSSDGINWDLRQDVDLNDDAHAGFLNLDGNPAGKWPDVCYVGLGSTSHTGIGNNNASNDGSVGEFWFSPTGTALQRLHHDPRLWRRDAEYHTARAEGASAFPNTTKVGLTFDKALDAASAGTAANYKVNGAAVTSALVRTNVANEVGTEMNLVQLTVPAALTSDFTVTVTGVKDTAGNAPRATVPGKILSLTSTDIGSPADQPGGPEPKLQARSPLGGRAPLTSSPLAATTIGTTPTASTSSMSPRPTASM